MKKQQHLQSREPQHWWWWWWWEIGAVSVTIVSMVLVIVILIKADGLALDAWPLPIQPNSLIAICTTIGKSSMMVAVAACLGQLKWRHFDKGSRPLHDIKIFDEAMLGVEPSAQQVLKFDTRMATIEGANASATLGVAKSYISKAYSVSSSGMINPELFNEDKARLQVRLLDGALGSAFNPGFHCPSNATRCSWPSVSTLGLCSTMEDVSETAEVKCADETNYYGIAEKDELNCLFKFPGFAGSDLFVTMDYGDSPVDPVVKKSKRFYFFTSKVVSTMDSARLGFNSTTILVARLGAKDGSRWKLGDPVQMSKYTLYWCEQTFQNVVAIPGTFQGAKAMTTVPLTPLRTSNATVGSSNSAVLIYQANSTGSPAEYSIMADMPRRLFGFFEQMFDFYELDYYTSPGSRLQARDDNCGWGCSLKGWLPKADWDVVIPRIADTLSSQMRSSGDNLDLTHVPGYAFTRETYIHVRWRWVSLPLGLSVSAALLLAATVIFTRNVPLYKSSPLALIRYDVEG
ncbi:hypothetical protein QBC44DRAFT_380210 [Cladorrhinum sp. PSN332]|nr:hypothetical protein QBC44DRAFT_380210 [Cladorrhinum sp. PSN332]